MELKDLRMPNNRVLIIPDDGYDKVKLGGIELELDTSYEPEMHAQTSGIVIKPCGHLYFNHDDKRSVPFDADIDIQEGDRVWFHYLAINNARERAMCFSLEESQLISAPSYFAVPYDLMYARKRGEEIVGVNGWFLVEPCEEELPKTSLILPDTMKGKVSKMRGIVLAAPSPLRAYRGKRWLGPDRGDVKVGDIVHFRKVDAVPLQYEFHANAIGKKKLYRMQEKDFLATE